VSANPACIDVYDGDVPAECFSEKLVRSRTTHHCGECGDPIKPGSLYERARGKWEGDWSTHKTCARCVNVRADYFRTWFYGHMVEDFRKTHGFDYRDGIPEDFGPCQKVRA
jgi:hypothetical protein